MTKGTKKVDQFDWSDDNVATLRRMWGQGKTGGAIADLLKTTRSSVIGKAHRLNLDRRDSPIKRGMRGPNVHNVGPAKKKGRRENLWTPAQLDTLRKGYSPGSAMPLNALAKQLGCSRERIASKAARLGLIHPLAHTTTVLIVKPKTSEYSRSSPPAFSGSRDATLADIGPRDCRFPTTPFTARHHLFCGHAVEHPGQVYCEFHHQIAHAPPAAANDAEPETIAA